MPGTPTVMTKWIAAYAFTISLDLEGLRKKLNELGLHTWIERDNHYYGDYLSARTHIGDGVYKIYTDDVENGYCLTLKLEGEDGPALHRQFDDLVHAAINDLLPASGARDIRPTESFD